jgi:putative phage-type endonuclease
MKPNIIICEDEAAWLEARKLGIGGSDAGAIAGVNPWKGPVQVYMEKVGLAMPTIENEKMYWGKKLEAIVADEFALKNGVELIHRPNEILQHPQYLFMLGSVDRWIANSNAILEIKNRSVSYAAMVGDDIITEYEQCQVQQYLGASGAEIAFLAVLVGGQKYIQIEVRRDEDVFYYLAKIEEEFWRCVQERRPPIHMENRLTTDTMKLLYPKSSGLTVDLSDEVEADDLIAQYKAADEAVKQAEEDKDRIKANLQRMLGEAEIGLTAAKRQIRWSNVPAKKLDTERLKKELPKIYDRFCKETNSRRFSVK